MGFFYCIFKNLSVLLHDIYHRMTKDKIIELGTKLGLPFNEKDNYPDMLAKNQVVFNGCNGQRFRIDGNWTDEEILTEFGKALILYGRRLQKMDIHRALSITGDHE